MLTELSIDGVGLTFPGSSVPTLLDVTLRASPGEFLAVVGPSGSGKSSLARALVGLWPATGGRVRLDNAAIGQNMRVYDHFRPSLAKIHY